MARTYFTIKGLKELDQKLKTLEPKIAKKVVRTALKNATKPVKEAVEQEAPVDTGALAASVKIKSRSRKGKTAANVQIGEGQFKGDTWYAAAVQFGTSKMAPNPFMQRAFDKTKDQVKSQIVSELRTALQNALKKK